MFRMNIYKNASVSFTMSNHLSASSQFLKPLNEFTQKSICKGLNRSIHSSTFHDNMHATVWMFIATNILSNKNFREEWNIHFMSNALLLCLMVFKYLNRRNFSTIIEFLDIIDLNVFLFKSKVSETGLCLHPQVEKYSAGPNWYSQSLSLDRLYWLGPTE